MTCAPDFYHLNSLLFRGFDAFHPLIEKKSLGLLVASLIIAVTFSKTSRKALLNTEATKV
jgi:hypothetical protein